MILHFRSILKRTLFMVMSTIILVSSLVVFLGLISAKHEVGEVFDARLAQQARTLQSLILTSLDNDMIVDYQDFLSLLEKSLTNNTQSYGHYYEQKMYFAIQIDDEPWLTSSDLQLESMTEMENGYALAKAENYTWRTFTLPANIADKSGSKVKILVAEREDVREETIEYLVLQSTIPELIMFPILAILVLFAIRSGLKPIRSLVSQIASRDPENLSSFNVPALPDELKAIQKELNDLLTKIQNMISREQRFISDAAHELRTPLAVLKIHAQNALQVQDEQDKNAALNSLISGVDRSTRLVEQLLVLARLEQTPKDEQQQAEIDLLKTARKILANLMPIALVKDIDITLDADEDVSWLYKMPESILETLLQNLVSNAIKFSQSQSNIEVYLSKTEKHYRIKVVDYGQGVSDEIISHLTERFYRQGNQSGAGLGLAIVQGIVEKEKGQLVFQHTSAEAGLTVIVTLPR